MEKDEWNKMDELALSTIMLTLEKSVYFNVADEVLTYDAWTKLSGLYKKQSVASQVYWLKKLVDLKMKEGTPMSDHLNEFNTIYKQLSAQGVRFDEPVRAMFLLITLLESWDTFRTALSNFAPLDDLPIGGNLSLPTPEPCNLSPAENPTAATTHVLTQGALPLSPLPYPADLTKTPTGHNTPLALKDLLGFETVDRRYRKPNSTFAQIAFHFSCCKVVNPEMESSSNGQESFPLAALRAQKAEGIWQGSKSRTKPATELGSMPVHIEQMSALPEHLHSVADRNKLFDRSGRTISHPITDCLSAQHDHLSSGAIMGADSYESSDTFSISSHSPWLNDQPKPAALSNASVDLEAKERPWALTEDLAFIPTFGCKSGIDGYKKYKREHTKALLQSYHGACMPNPLFVTYDELEADASIPSTEADIVNDYRKPVVSSIAHDCKNGCSQMPKAFAHKQVMIHHHSKSDTEIKHAGRQLEELLQCFLSINHVEHHDVIVQAFTEVWERVVIGKAV
ncbi:hypothetical protein L7F22_028001 [Adiantum nelumboides]|nr:hypothetical protein [Adiantum nelumboides]